MNAHLKYLLILFVFQACQIESPIGSNAKLEKLKGDFSFTEGPTSDAAGNIYFTDQPNNKIIVYSNNGEFKIFANDAGRSNGLYIDGEHNLWACADEKNQLWKFGLSGEKEIVLNPEGEPKFNGPNDIWVHKKGFVYFTDPIYQRPYWISTHDTLPQALYQYKNGMAILLDSNFVQPNGIVGNSEDNKLFVADIGADITYRYDIMKDGSITNKIKWVDQGSDGMTLDNKGNLYLTGNGVDIFNVKQKHVMNIPVPEEWTANICFGGKDNNKLFITASQGLYCLSTKVKGIE